MRVHSIVAVSVASMSTFIVASSGYAQINNGGFENPSMVPAVTGEWQYVMGATRDSSSPRTGLFAANLNNTAQAANANVQQVTLPGSVLPGSTYVLSFWARASYGVSGIGQSQLAFLNSAGNILPGSPQFSNIPESAGYVRYTQNFIAPANSSAIFLGFNAVTGAVSGASSQVFLDDVRFAVIPEPASITAIGLVAAFMRRRR